MINELQLLGLNAARIQASHEDIILLGRDASVDWNLFQIKRKMVQAIANTAVYRISFSLNKPAEILCFSSLDKIRTSNFNDLPTQVQTAITQDGMLHPCSMQDQQVFL